MIQRQTTRGADEWHKWEKDKKLHTNKNNEYFEEKMK